MGKKMKGFIAILALLLPCFALVSCKQEQFYTVKVKVSADSQAKEPKVARADVNFIADAPSHNRYSILRYSMTIDGPDGADIVGATAINKKGSYTCTIGHEADKCTISWEALKSDRVSTDPFDVVLSYSDGSKAAIAYKFRPTIMAVTTGILVGGLWYGLVWVLLAPILL